MSQKKQSHSSKSLYSLQSFSQLANPKVCATLFITYQITDFLDLLNKFHIRVINHELTFLFFSANFKHTMSTPSKETPISEVRSTLKGLHAQATANYGGGSSNKSVEKNKEDG